MTLPEPLLGSPESRATSSPRSSRPAPPIRAPWMCRRHGHRRRPAARRRTRRHRRGPRRRVVLVPGRGAARPDPPSDSSWRSPTWPPSRSKMAASRRRSPSDAEWFERMAHSDPSPVWRTATFDQVLQLEIARASRQGGEVSVAVFDVDDFGATNHRRQCRGRRHPARGGGARGLGASRGHGRPLRRRRVRPRCAGVRRAHGRATSPGRHRRTARRRGSSHLGLGGARAFPRRRTDAASLLEAAGVASQRAREEGAARSARPNEPTTRPRRGQPVVCRAWIGSVGAVAQGGLEHRSVVKPGVGSGTCAVRAASSPEVTELADVHRRGPSPAIAQAV